MEKLKTQNLGYWLNRERIGRNISHAKIEMKRKGRGEGDHLTIQDAGRRESSCYKTIKWSFQFFRLLWVSLFVETSWRQAMVAYLS